jgi:hypothetical protein
MATDMHKSVIFREHSKMVLIVETVASFNPELSHEHAQVFIRAEGSG